VYVATLSHFDTKLQFLVSLWLYVLFRIFCESFLSGMQALLSVLDKFRVENRRNMFVIKESKSGAIFYIRFS